MGTIRTLLALSVLLSHVSYGGLLVGGRTAVQMFYMISGFLISYVLVEKKAYSGSLFGFYCNRYLRLYPIYACVALATFAFFIAFPETRVSTEFFDTFRAASAGAAALLVFTNLTIFLQDAVLFLGVSDGAMSFVTGLQESSVVLQKGLLIPQAWTLGVELSFYLAAPFILKRRRVLLALLLLSVTLRLYLLKIGIGFNDPWKYRFFPTELSLFLLGALSQQYLTGWYKKFFAEHLNAAAMVATGVLLGLILACGFIPVGPGYKTAVLFGLFAAALPLTFAFQSRYAWDRWIGELSYPLYICHVLVLWIVLHLFAVETKIPIVAQEKLPIAMTVVVLSLVVSIALNRWVALPMERLRDRFRSSSAPASQPKAGCRSRSALGRGLIAQLCAGRRL